MCSNPSFCANLGAGLGFLEGRDPPGASPVLEVTMITMRAVRQGLLPGLIVAGVLAASILYGSTVALHFQLVAACSYGYLGAPTVTGVSPNSGSILGNQTATVTGCGFTGATSVKFGAQEAYWSVTNDSTIAITATPSHAAGVVDVHVTTSKGTSAANPPSDQFTYVGPCTSVTAPAVPASTAKAGTIIHITAAGVGCPNPLYQFYVLNPGGSWTIAQPFSPRTTFNWDTGGPEPAGTYYYSVWVKDATSSAAYDAFMPGAAYTITSTPCATVSATPSVASPQPQGTPVTWTATSTGCTAPLYEFWILAPGSTTWQMAQGYSASNTFSWPTGSINGTYRVSVWVRDASSAGTHQFLLSSYDAFFASVAYTLT